MERISTSVKILTRLDNPLKTIKLLCGTFFVCCVFVEILQWIFLNGSPSIYIYVMELCFLSLYIILFTVTLENNQ